MEKGKLERLSIPFQLTEEEALDLRAEKRLKFLSFADDPTYFVILDKEHYFRKSKSGIYYPL